jgi:hypothetical protein
MFTCEEGCKLGNNPVETLLHGHGKMALVSGIERFQNGALLEFDLRPKRGAIIKYRARKRSFLLVG